MPRLLPREPSVLGMMVVSAAAGLSVSRVTALGLAASAPALLLHMASFDGAFASLRARRAGALAAYTVLNSLPYALAAAWGLSRLEVLSLAVAASMLAAVAARA